MKKIMILGGGVNQMPLIEAAKKCGYTVVLCDFSDHAPGIALADAFHLVSIIDAEAVLEVAKKENIDGIVANTEAAMKVVAYVAETMNLVGNSVNAIDTLASKKSFRRMQKECGMFAPSYFEVSTLAELNEKIGGMKFPVIIKPSESSGTRGTTKIASADEAEKIEQAYELCKSFSRNDLVTVEEYISMPSLTVIEGDIFVNEGEILWDGLFLTRRSAAAPMIPMTYMFPIRLEEEKYERVRRDLAAAIKNSGIKHGQYNAEAYFTEDGELFIIEINARQGGNQIPRAIKLHSGIDMDKLLVTTAVGDNSYWEELKSFKRLDRIMAWHLIFPRNAGVYRGLEISETIADKVMSTQEFEPVGTVLENTTNAASIIGMAEVEFKDFAEQNDICEQIEELIVPIVE